jgi:hypothetical protein
VQTRGRTVREDGELNRGWRCAVMCVFPHHHHYCVVDINIDLINIHFSVFELESMRHIRKVKIQRSETCTTFLIYKSDTVNELPVHNFIFQLYFST